MEWIPITEGLPVPGSSLIVTTRLKNKKKRSMRTFVWYIRKPLGDGYGFYSSDDGYLDPAEEEVVAWMSMPDIYYGDKKI